jgi:hypothetical protein
MHGTTVRVHTTLNMQIFMSQRGIGLLSVESDKPGNAQGPERIPKAPAFAIPTQTPAGASLHARQEYIR